MIRNRETIARDAAVTNRWNLRAEQRDRAAIGPDADQRLCIELGEIDQALPERDERIERVDRAEIPDAHFAGRAPCRTGPRTRDQSNDQERETNATQHLCGIVR